MAAIAPEYLAIVRRDAPDTFERLSAMATDRVAVVWDRREGERRQAMQPHAPDRRQRDRRRGLPRTWWTFGFLLVRQRQAAT
jgi:hypothetical protein